MNLIIVDEKIENDKKYLKFLKDEAGGNFNGFIIFRVGGNLKNFHGNGCRTFLIQEKESGLESVQKFFENDGQKLEKLIICSESTDFCKKTKTLFPLSK